MTTVVISCFLFLWRHKEKFAAIIVVLAVALAMKIDFENKAATDCTPGTSSASSFFGEFAYPTDKKATNISSPYGIRDGTMHRGIDIAGAEGTPIYAFAEGTVADAGPASGFGNWIVIDHTTPDGKTYSTVYGHMYDNGVLVRTGQRVTPGQRIGLIGNNGQSFGAHLHFEVWPGTRLNGGSSVDPVSWLEKSGEVDGGGASSPPPARTADQQSQGNPNAVTTLRARQIIDVGQKRNMPPKVIASALAVGLVESNLRNLASEAVPESKNYPNDGVAPGDHDSVGIFQQRRSTQSAAVDTNTAMDPVWQINTYYNYVEKQPNWRNADPGTLAADVQRPREDLRGKYAERMDQAQTLLRTYGASAAGAAGLGGGCGTPGSGQLPSGPAGNLAKKAVAAALSQVGKPYIWGAEGPNAYDCSGLTRWAYLQASGGKVGLPHYTGDSGNPGQLAVGIEVPDEKSLQPGDLILYNGSRTQASHVAMYIGDGKVVHAQTEGTPVLVTPVSGGGKVVMMRRIPDHAGPDGKVDRKKADQS
ncbi:peptidoglycan DD-metalloendopeptidase family protein [Gordonia rubripertincta]|uniref:peptidoglycan DD-metalloendopeptidase family protein n=1 Tax=Gordonia rubripertincta TaxID=36822 RepID=UPI0011801094|nr:peptidoglycan DD-metalloendopeptidase family protein [Gordonia rubripertincta]TSD93497.1 peptidoglycan DD-metalloendopeptidase family protein [Gordonia rubripertincta]